MQIKSLLIVFCLFLSACSTTKQAPDTTYYLFDAEPVAQKQKIAKPRVLVNKVKVPDYLSTNQLVMRDSGHILIKANYHSWADSLDEAIQRALLNDLNHLNSEKEFVIACNDCVSVNVTVDHFYPSSDGKLLLSGSFEVATKNDQNTISRFQLLDELHGNGYANAVKQMRQQVAQLAIQINESIE
ncbi:membrane integrity-associated transporter subunit PqiC [Glaciecola sp. MF2-115]|uniref:PqiC family protein n=1 Tax=Glaciecola sp. MF2-115 TaxID=3384827 RepID=UPI00399FEFAA